MPNENKKCPKTKTEFGSSFISLLNEMLILSLWKIYPNKMSLRKNEDARY